jgi:chromosome segregation ATPase
MSTQSADRLNQISAELATLLEARISELVSAMKGAEQATRQIVSTEMEIARYRQVVEALTADRASIQKEATELGARAEAVRGEHAELVRGRDRLRDEVTAAERAITSQREQNRQLQVTADGLVKETDELRARVKTLEDNISRMRKMREELLSGIGNLTRDMSQLGLANKE